MVRILIAEDEPAISSLVAMTLTGAGYHCTVAGDGLTAADLLDRESFDLALLDIMLPGCDGFELLARVESVLRRYHKTAEHYELDGVTVDIVALSYQILDEAQANTPEQQWLMEHCWEYGFILRYPKDKQDITGIIYEPWHYRCVGVEAALEMKKSGQCLEEYLKNQ